MGRKLLRILPKRSGRNNSGRVTVRHQGGREKRFLREIDFKRDKRDIPAVVSGLEYDPNRGVKIALLNYVDGAKRYILAPEGLKIGEEVMAGAEAEPKVGNALPLSRIPIGTIIHNIEIKPGRGGQLARGAGAAATLTGKEEGYAVIRLPSTEQRKIKIDGYATVGQLGNLELKSKKFTKAGTKRHLGIRPTVRGVAQNPDSHPHGGGEGRSGIGMPSPKTPWGKPTLGKRTRKRIRYSDGLIIKRRA